MGGNKKILLKPIILIVACMLTVGCLFAATSKFGSIRALAYPQWINAYEVGISFDETKLVTTKDATANEDTVTVKIASGIPEGVSMKEIKVKIRTRNVTAVAGQDYTAFDEVVSLRKSSSNGNIFYDTISIKVNKNVERFVVNGVKPYFNIELYEVLTANFSINESARSLRVNLTSTADKLHDYMTDNSLGHQILKEYSKTCRDTYDNLKIYHENKSGQTLSASQAFKDNGVMGKDYLDTGLANLYTGGYTKLDESGVTMSSWCTLKLYDGDTSGVQLYTVTLRHIDYDKLNFGRSYGDMKHENESFASEEYVFQAKNKLNWGEDYYMKVSSRTLYETFKSDSNWYRETYEWNLAWIVVDEASPTVKGWYVDRSTARDGDKIRISVRFNEPVNCADSDIPKIKLRTNLTGSGGFNNYKATFNCVSSTSEYGGMRGLATDTLVFEFDPATAKDSYGDRIIGTINNIEIEGFDNINKVCDYGRNREDQNNYCKNYNTLASLESDKCSPRQLRSSLAVSFDNRSPFVEQTGDIPNEYVRDFSTKVTVSGTGNIQGTYYLWSRSPNLNYMRVLDPVDSDLDKYYEFNETDFIPTVDVSVDQSKNYYVYRKLDLCKVYEYEHNARGARYEDDQRIYQETLRYRDFAPFGIMYSADGIITASLNGESGTYYLHVYAKSTYSDEFGTIRRFGPIRVDSDAPEFDEMNIDGNVRTKNVSVKIDELSGLKQVVLYYSENWLYGNNDAKTIVVLERNDNGTFADPNGFETVYENGVLTFSIQAEDHIGLSAKDGEKAFGDYYLGLKGVDIVGNVSDIYEYETAETFDMRDLFAPFVKIGGVTVTDDTDDRLPVRENTTFYAENAYVVDISSGEKTIVIGRPGQSDAVGGYYLSNAYKIKDNVRIPLAVSGDGTIGQAGTVYFTGYTVHDNNGTNAEVSFNATTVGYYEFTTFAKYGEDSFYSETQRFYVTDGNAKSEGKNFNNIFNVGVNFKNKLFVLGSSRYYSRTGTGMGSSVSAYYNDSVEPVVFSDREKAADYVQMMEYRDFYAIRITEDDVRAFNNGVLTVEREESRRPSKGEIWIRYKSTTWNFSTAQRDWVYYYYGDTSSSLVIDVDKLSGRLASVVDKVVNIVIQKGSDLYLNSSTGMSENGAVYVDPVRLPRTFTATSSAGNPSTELTYGGSGNNPLEYAFDREVYYDKYNDRDDTTLISSYRFNYLNTTKIYYAPAKIDEETNQVLLSIDEYKNDFKLLTTPYLTQSTSGSGVYVIRELDESGMRDYAVYVDKDVPSILTQYADIDGAHTMHYNQWWNETKDGEVLHTTEFTIQLIEDKVFNKDVAYNDYHGFGLDADTYTYVAVFDVTDGGRTFKAGFSLKDLAAVDSAYELPYGVYEIEVCDRAGNRFSMTVSRAKQPLTTNVEITKDDNITFIIPDRIPSEIESVYVTRPGKSTELIDFAERAETFTDENGKEQYGLRYTDAGRYEFTVTDKYGYTISPATDPDPGKMHTIGELTRVNPYENVKWVTRTDDGRFVDLDAENISLFRADNYYITSDDKLSFVLDSTSVYSYVFTGNVKATPIQRDIGGKTYVYVNVDSTERWSVKIYYTLYPDICVTYNRIAKKAIVPAAIDLRPAEKDSNGVAQADPNNRIVVYVTTYDEIIDPITVRLRTRNKSAIAELGDYDAYQGTVTLTPSAKEQMVVIQVHPSGFSTYNNATYQYGNRTFDLLIESIDGNAEKGKSSVECACPGAQELNITTKDGIQVFEEYLKGAKFGMPNIAFERLYSSTATGRSHEESHDFSISPAWMSTFVDSGLADVYVGMKLSLSADDSSNYPDLRLTLSDVSANSQLFRVYVNEISENCGVVFGYSYDGDLKTSNETYDKNSSITLNEMRGVASAGRYFLMPAGSKGTFRYNVQEPEGMYITYASAGQGGTYPVYNYIVPARNVNDAVAYGLLIDTKAPEIESWHIDHSTIRLGENLRLSVRFSEPVYISGKAPVITANVVGALSSIDFNYVGGAGTDTLYFEFDPSAYQGEVNINAVTIASVTHFGSICDYGYNASKRNNFITSTPEIPKNTEWDPSCSLDTRLPTIDLDTNYIMPSGPQRTASVPISIGKTTAGANLEYSWTVETEAPAMYEKALTLTSTQQKVNLEANGLSGTYYLHVYMKSVYGKVATKTFGPFLFDNTVPNISGLMVEEATKGLKERNVVFYINDEPYGEASSGVAQVYLYYLFKDSSDPQIVVLYDKNQDANRNLIQIPENSRASFLLTYETLGIDKEQQKDVTMALYAVDGIGNSPNISSYTFCPTVVNFDARSDVEVEMTCSKQEFFNADGTPVYNILGGDPRFDFEFSRQADEYAVRELYVGGKRIPEDKFDDYMDYNSDGSGVHVTFKRNVVGFICINFKAISGTDVNQSVQESSDVTFYLTSGVNTAETLNYKNTQSGTLFINKVYMLDTAVFYYHNGEGVRQLNYNETTKLMAFSSRDKAVEYVRYYEMRDLGVLEVMSASMASSLNTGDGSFRKAAADTSVIASVGQIWLRYKRATWDNATTSDAWVYYYYGTSSEIDPERLPASLSAAISQVSDTIVDRGGYRYLTSADDGLDKNGSPSLDKKQIATEKLTSFVTLSGSEMRSAVSYTGDPDIYDSRITTSAGEECSLVTTYRFEYGDHTKLFYTNKTDADGNPIEKEYKLLAQGTVFGSLNIDGGVYWLRECGDNGVRDFKIYLDKTAPTINVVYENAKGDSVERELDSSIDGMSVNGKTLRIKGFSETSTEIDSMAYIALFKKNGVLLDVYRKEDIPKSGIEVSEGQYFIEISDRSGNVYRVNVSMNSTPLTVKVTVEENRHVRISCNRDATEIKNFEIYLDGRLLESNYSASLTYYQAGVYSIRIEDWFGNTFSYDYELKRELPKINWYYVEGETYVQYDGTQASLRISKAGEREYQIVTNKELMFTFDTSSDYTYEFADKSLSVTVREFNGFTRVRVNDTTDWTLTVRYARYPEIYVVYKCITDLTAPIINVTARQDVVKYFDMQQLDAANAASPKQGDEEYFVPDSVYFTVNKTVSKAVRDNSTVYSPLITLQFSDKSVCNRVEVYLDGVMIREYNENEGVNNVTVTRFGEYRIVAADTLGNQSEFSFINRMADDARFYVDEREISLKLSPADSIVYEDGEYIYAPDVYAYDHLEMMYGSSATLAFTVEKNGERKYLRFENINGSLYQIAYRLIKMTDGEGNPMYDDNGEEIYSYQQIYSATVIADVNAAEADTAYMLADEKEAGVDIYVRFDADGKMFYRVDAPKDGEATVEMRVMYDAEYQPYFVKAVMCGELPKITFEKALEDGSITPETTEQVIYLNSGFYIAETDFTNITEIKIAYSETTQFNDYFTVYTQNDGYVKKVFGDEGFYSVVVKNIYGRVATFTVTMASELKVVVTANYDDGGINQYSTAVKRSFYANESIVVDVYFERITYVLTYNGIRQEAVTKRDPSGICSMTWKDAGEYHLETEDDFGNVVAIDFEIEDRPFRFKKDYLTGYNEKALRLDEGYTNRKLSVDAEKMIGDGVLQVVAIRGEEEFVVYDVLGSDEIAPSEQRTKDVIGSMGDGEYVFRMRNAYGNVTETVLHYRGTETVSVSRLTRTAREPEPVTFVAGELNKVYSNYNVTFSTVAGRYEIRIDESKADMPLVVAYPTDGEEAGEYVKRVTYVDEYGFEYEFEVDLVRKTLEIDLSEFMDVVTIKDVTMTQGNVKILFDQSVSCEVSLSGGERVPYSSGEELTSDGTYRFYITDVAGNVFTTSVKKDTLAEFTFINSATDRVVENGSVIMQGSARFLPVNKDSSHIDLVVLNGAEYDVTKSVGFGETGKWEFLVSDDIGNKAYYYFYVINHSVSRFEYDSPYTYKITNLQFDNGDGVKVSYLNSVLQNRYNSRMIFSESGTYSVTVSSIVSSAQFSFDIIIDKTPPIAQLVGVENGGTTTNNVTLKNCRAGEEIRIYKDGQLISVTEVTSDTMKMPEITEKGSYKVVVTNDAGNEEVFEFTRKYTANMATTISVIVICLLAAMGLFIVLVFRKRIKV